MVTRNGLTSTSTTVPQKQQKTVLLPTYPQHLVAALTPRQQAPVKAGGEDDDENNRFRLLRSSGQIDFTALASRPTRGKDDDEEHHPSLCGEDADDDPDWDYRLPFAPLAGPIGGQYYV